MIINQAGWSRYKKSQINLIENNSHSELKENLKKFDFLIPSGNFRSYGDSALYQNVLSTLKLNKIIFFDDLKGIIKTQSGVTLKEIIKLIVPKGWFLKVTPGTKYVTVGGALASDIHGKEHHKAGCFSDCIDYFEILMADGVVYKCSKSTNKEIFQATCGGMGLTGIITEVQFNLKKINSAFLDQEVNISNNLKDTLDLFDQKKDVNYSVAWLDCIKRKNNNFRSIFYSAAFSNNKNYNLKFNKTKKIFSLIKFNLINNFTINFFNKFFYIKHILFKKKSMVSLDNFFYPLDKLEDWNLFYGENGFLQYQFILPKQNSQKGIQEILDEINNSKTFPSLAVLKLHGKSNENILSFPLEGYSLALDFRYEKRIFTFFERLDQIVLKYKGRIYLTKDSVMKKDFFYKCYNKLEKFIEFRKKMKLDKKFSSFQSERLGL